MTSPGCNGRGDCLLTACRCRHNSCKIFSRRWTPESYHGRAAKELLPQLGEGEAVLTAAARLDLLVLGEETVIRDAVLETMEAFPAAVRRLPEWQDSGYWQAHRRNDSPHRGTGESGPGSSGSGRRAEQSSRGPGRRHLRELRNRRNAAQGGASWQWRRS